MIGQTVSHYRITERLGAGGMGEVFLAEDSRLQRKAAIKFLPAKVAADPASRQRFLVEARAASALSHPNVCVIYDVGETDTGLPPGWVTAISQEEPAPSIRPPSSSESNPQRTSELLPLPDVPTTATKRLLPSRCNSSSVCSSRPKNR